jgi:hypothetical protein
MNKINQIDQTNHMNQTNETDQITRQTELFSRPYCAKLVFLQPAAG